MQVGQPTGVVKSKPRDETIGGPNLLDAHADPLLAVWCRRCCRGGGLPLPPVRATLAGISEPGSVRTMCSLAARALLKAAKPMTDSAISYPGLLQRGLHSNPMSTAARCVSTSGQTGSCAGHRPAGGPRRTALVASAGKQGAGASRRWMAGPVHFVPVMPTAHRRPEPLTRTAPRHLAALDRAGG